MATETSKLDYFDRRILFELDKDARISTTQIGKKIRKSKQFVDYRIKKLEEKGIHNYDKNGLRVYVEQRSSVSYEKSIYLPNWMCKIIHDWYEDNN